MKSNYRAVLHYYLKKGMEEKGLKFLEEELLVKGMDLGCHYIELWQDEKDPLILGGIAVWNTREEAKTFQSRWGKKEKEFISLYCTQPPKREFFKIKQIYTEKARKVA